MKLSIVKTKFAVIAGLAFVGGFASVVLSQTSPRFDARVRNDFFAGFRGDKEAFDRGMKYCEQALATDPDNAEALVWHGAGLFFEGGRKMREDPGSGLPILPQGEKQMDRAVGLEPDKTGVRIPRGASFFVASRHAPDEVAPEYLRRALDDYESVYKLQKDRWETLPAHAKGELLIGLADGWSRAGEEAKAKFYFDRILAELPASSYAASASEWMRTKTLPEGKAGCLGCHAPQKP